MELRFASLGAEAVLPQKALGGLVGVGMRGLLVDVGLFILVLKRLKDSLLCEGS